MRYAKPKSIDEALALLSEDRWRMLAGGSDFYPAQGSRPLRDNILDINGLSDLRGIHEDATHVVFGARATWTDIIRADLPPAFASLKQAAREVGSIQIQNTGTIAGNLCNASPAADGVPPLLTLDAEVELRSLGGTQTIPLSDFILGNRKTALRTGDMVTAVRVPKAAARGTSHFVKLGARRYLVISIAMVAARVVVGQGGTIEEAAIAVGACSAVAVRLKALEQHLVGHPVASVREIVEAYDFAELSPIDDVRGSGGYRRDAAREIVCRALAGAAASAGIAEEVAA
ncbi:xanthine dehydrogenase family protein subunit M [Mesorhizobium sp. CAU 1732]|uniref:FAD binding domain-containing protein n=1 Tax=Mesorhizobium sp. CAU 1732 TaxID=3140358 RepID=UPI0032603834